MAIDFRRHDPTVAADPPQQVAVVGGGIIGLCTAWFLQEAGVQVTVYDRGQFGAGASWGNAGWLTPALAAPLPAPAVLRYGLRAVLSPRSPVYLPLRPDTSLARFLGSFVLHSTARRWRAGMAAYAPLNERATEAFDVLAAAGLEARTYPAEPFLACFAREDDAAVLVRELGHIRATGQDLSFSVVGGRQARALEPALGARVEAAVEIRGQRYLHPPEYVRALADGIRARGGEIIEDTAVTHIRDERRRVTVLTDSEQRRYDTVVVATGALLRELTARHGVRQPVQAGRGYSFSVAVEKMPRGPLYFPTQRVACTPLGDRLRIAGMMEFRHPHAPLDPRRIAAIVDGVRPLLRGVDLDDRRDEWVGSRPCTADGLPLVGATASPRVYVAGGHGMWGITLGPVTGMLLTQAILKREAPPELAPFNPLR